MAGLDNAGLEGNSTQPRLDSLDCPGLSGVVPDNGVTLPTLAKMDLLVHEGERNVGAGIVKGTCIMI
jgi:hypothetical protein